MRILNWNSLSEAARREALQRPSRSWAWRRSRRARAEIIERVRSGGDAAILKALTEKFDGVLPSALEVTPQEFEAADRELRIDQHAALERALAAIQRFHAAQTTAPLRMETAPGVLCERFSVPIFAPHQDSTFPLHSAWPCPPRP